VTRRGRRLPRAFFARDPLELAPLLLNKLLVREEPDGTRLAVRLVEVEAYRGAADPGSHAYHGPTPRTTTMFGPPGHLYVYFTYGMHWCANVVALAPSGDASAVLIRAAEPVDGLDLMRSRRPAARQDTALCSGPARLTPALGLDRDHDGASLVRGPLGIYDDAVAPPRRPARSTRIGLATGRGDTVRWRWFVPGNAHVSRGR
jgi:DNA-3-methyladenine glycosylase